MGHSDKPLFVIGSILTGMMLIVGFNVVMEMKHGHGDAQPVAGYALPEPEPADDAATAGTPGESAAPAAAVDMAALVAAADPAKGEKQFKFCGSCHTSKKGDPPAIGPNLHGVFERDVASQAAFSGYSPAMKAHGGKWTVAVLSEFLANPKAAIPGTKMIFRGISDDQKRAELIAYLKTLSD